MPACHRWITAIVYCPVVINQMVRPVDRSSVQMLTQIILAHTRHRPKMEISSMFSRFIMNKSTCISGIRCLFVRKCRAVTLWLAYFSQTPGGKFHSVRTEFFLLENIYIYYMRKPYPIRAHHRSHKLIAIYCVLGII